MRQDGSVTAPTPLPAGLAPVVVVLGILAMLATAPRVLPLGLRTGLMLSELALVVPGLLASAALGRPLRVLLGQPARLPRTRWLALACGASLWILSLGLFELQYALWRPPPGYLEAFRFLHEQLRPKDAVDLVVSLLAIAVVPSLCEEVLFRGLVLPSLQRPLGAMGASLASAALFGLIHLDRTIYGELSLYRVPFAFAVGLGFAALRLLAAGLLPCVIAHATLNALTFAAAPFADDPARGLPDPRPLLGIALLALGLALTAATLHALIAQGRRPTLGG